MEDQIAIASRVGGQRELDTERGGDLGPTGIDVHERHLRRRKGAQQARHAAADHSGPDYGDAVAEQWRRVPEGVDRGLDRAGEDGASRGYVLGHDGHRARRHHVSGLVRIEAENRTAAQLRGPLLNRPDVEVAVLDGSGEVPLLEGRPHRRVLVRRHRAAEDQRLGAAADAGERGADQHVVRSGIAQRGRSDLTAARGAQPERVRIGPPGHHATGSSCSCSRVRRCSTRATVNMAAKGPGPSIVEVYASVAAEVQKAALT